MKNNEIIKCALQYCGCEQANQCETNCEWSDVTKTEEIEEVIKNCHQKTAYLGFIAGVEKIENLIQALFLPPPPLRTFDPT